MKKTYIQPVTETVVVGEQLMQATSWTDPDGNTNSIINGNPDPVGGDDEAKKLMDPNWSVWNEWDEPEEDK